MTQQNPEPTQWKALKKIVKRLPANLAYYGSALGAIVIAGSGAEGMASIVGNIGAGLLGNLIAEVAKGEDILDDDIRQRAQEAITKSDIERLLTERDFWRGYVQLIRRLDAQKAVSQDIIDELRDGFSKVATAAQLEEVKELLLQVLEDKKLSQKQRVFISYRRSDASDFAQHLHDALEAADIDAWLDVRDMPSGDTFIAHIERAIADADYFLLVGTPQAIESDYCRDEWKKAIEKYKPIIPIMLMGEYKDLPQEAYAYLNDARDFRDDSQFDAQVAQLVKQIQVTPTPAGEARGLPSLPSHYLPRPELLATLREALTHHKTTVLTSPSQKVGVQGMGGVGKSVLAMALARDYFVRRTFKDGVFWLTLGTAPRLFDLWSQLAGYLGYEGKSFKDAKEAQDFFEQTTQGREILLILDDIWESDHAEAFLHLGENCRLFASSRQDDILRAIDAHTYAIGILTDTEAEALLKRVAKVDKLPAQGKGIIQACGNLPLAIAMIGAMVQGKRETYWQDALDALEEADLEGIAARFPEYPHANLFLALKVSIDALDADLRERYYDFAIFPEDVAIPEEVPLTFWKPAKARDVRKKLDALVSRNLLTRADDGTLSLHDLQLSYLRRTVADSPQRNQRLLQQYNPTGVAWQNVCDKYLWKYLAFHMVQADRTHDLYELLVGSKDWMEQKYATFRTDESYVADLGTALAQFDELVSPDKLSHFVRLWAAKNLAQSRTTVWDDIDLEIMTRIGRSEDTLFFARTRTDPFERCKGLLRVAFALLEMKQAVSPYVFALLETSARSILDKWDKVDALYKIAKLYIKDTQPAEAFRVAEIILLTPIETIGEQDQLNSYLHALATEFANANQPHYVLNTANLIQNDLLTDYRASAIGVAIRVFGFTGNIADGVEWASQLEQRYQTQMYLKLLEGLLEGGHKDYKTIANHVENSAKDDLVRYLHFAELLLTVEDTDAKRIIESIADALIVDHPYLLQPPPEPQERVIPDLKKALQSLRSARIPIETEPPQKRADIDVLSKLGKLLSKIGDPRSQQFTAWVLYSVDEHFGKLHSLRRDFQVRVDLASVFGMQQDSTQFSNFVIRSLLFAEEFKSETARIESLRFVFTELFQTLSWDDALQLLSTINDSDWRFTCLIEWIKYSIRHSRPVNTQAIEVEIQLLQEKEDIDKLQRITCVVAEIDTAWAEQLFREIQNYRQLEETNKTRSAFDRLRQKLLLVYAKCSPSMVINAVSGSSTENQAEIRLELAEWFIDINVDIARALLENIESSIHWRKYRRLPILWARLGEIERAVKIGETYSIDDVDEWSQLVIALAQQGYVSEAKQLIEGKKANYEIWGKVFASLSDEDGLKWALLAIEGSFDDYPEGKAEALTKIAIALLTMGHPLGEKTFSDAVAAARAIPDDQFEASGMRNLQLKDMALDFARGGFPEKALLIFNTMSRTVGDEHFHQDRNSILRAAISSFCKKGDVGTVLQMGLMSQIDHYDQSGRDVLALSMGDVARAFCSRNDIEQAQEYIEKIGEKRVLTLTLRDLSSAWIRRQQVKSALLTLGEANLVDYLDAYSGLVYELERIYPQQAFDTLREVFAIFEWLDPVWAEMQTWVNQLSQ